MPCLAWVPVVLQPALKGLAQILNLCTDIPVLANWVAMAALQWVLEVFFGFVCVCVCVCVVLYCIVLCCIVLCCVVHV